MEDIVRVASREVYRSRWMTMREDQIRRLDGSYGSYGVVDRPDYAMVIARDGERFCLVEQFRYPLGLRRWEFPSGCAPDLGRCCFSQRISACLSGFSAGGRRGSDAWLWDGRIGRAGSMM
jgi:hypothetical protein